MRDRKWVSMNHTNPLAIAQPRELSRSLKLGTYFFTSPKLETPEHILFGITRDPLGHILVAESHHGVCAVFLSDSPEKLIEELQKSFPHAHFDQKEIDSSLLVLIQDPKQVSHFRLDIRGTPFQRIVWKTIRKIPRGEVRTYSQIAAEIGHPKAVRAVANACASNRLAILIPCHRVVRKDGKTSGYRWCTKRRESLLIREGLTFCKT